MTYKKDQRDFTQFLQDILDAIDDIEGFIRGMEFNESSSKGDFVTPMKEISLNNMLFAVNDYFPSGI